MRAPRRKFPDTRQREFSGCDTLFNLFSEITNDGAKLQREQDQAEIQTAEARRIERQRQRLLFVNQLPQEVTT